MSSSHKNFKYKKNVKTNIHELIGVIDATKDKTTQQGKQTAPNITLALMYQ